MTRIQTFDEFAKGSSGSIDANLNPQGEPISEATDKDKVVKITPQEGEVARWRVVLKKGSENIADNAVPQVIAELAKDKDFQTWWNTKEAVKDPTSNDTFMATGSQLIAFAHKIKEVDKNLFGKEVAKYEIGFRVYATMYNSKTFLNYDVSKAEPKGSVKVGDSPAKLVVWSDESLPALTVQTKIEAGTANAYAETSPAIQLQLTKFTSGSRTVSSTSGTSGSAGSSGTSGAAGSSTYTGLKLNANTKNPKVEELQKKIISLNNDASAKIKAVGGADGKYGKATATAIGILVGTNKEENEITADIATKLDAALAKAPAQTTTADTKTAQKAGTQKTTASSTKTPGGKTVIF